jgi:putative PIN family toxin of toxin-antitoxin system
MIRVVLDTNVLVASISSQSPYHWLWQAFKQGNYEICVTTDILEEYAEIIERYFSVADVEYTLNQILLSRNVVQIIRYFEWDAIKADPDDNKFFDCAVAANADFIVSEDKHFNVLKTIPFPFVSAIRLTQFRQVLDKQQ